MIINSRFVLIIRAHKFNQVICTKNWLNKNDFFFKIDNKYNIYINGLRHR